MIDPHDIEQASLSNNLVLTNCYSPLSQMTSEIKEACLTTVDKGSNSLRMSFEGALQSTTLQLSHEKCVLSLSEISQISQYIRNVLFKQMLKQIDNEII